MTDTELAEIEARWSRHASDCACDTAPSDITALVAEVRRLQNEKNAVYAERNKLVALLANAAHDGAFGDCTAWRSEHAATDWDLDWRCIVFVGTPEGQLSWHFHDSERALVARLPTNGAPWDGHTTEEKYRRVERLCGVTK